MIGMDGTGPQTDRTPAGQSQPETGQNDKVILLANEPRMFREMLIRALDKTPDTQLVMDVADVRRLPLILARTNAEWLIIELSKDGKIPDRIAALLEIHPTISLMAVSRDGSQIHVYRAGEGNERQRYSLEDISLAELVAILEPANPA